MDLLHRFAHGELAAFEALFREYQREVHGWIARIVRDPSTAEDLTIETFWRIWRSSARFDPARGFAGWARRIATNVAIDHLKSTRRVVLPVAPPSVEAPGDALARRDLLASTRRALAVLPPHFRVAVTLALIEGRPYDEIAEALGTSVGTVKSRVFRGTRRLRRELERRGIRP